MKIKERLELVFVGCAIMVGIIPLLVFFGCIAPLRWVADEIARRKEKDKYNT